MPRMHPARILFWIGLILLPASLPCPAQRMKKTAWQQDARLGQKWQRLTGRFIFQKACLSCHVQGPATYTRSGWASKLQGFPSAKHPALPQSYRDLTAMFDYGRYVPNQNGRLNGLRAFLASAAPKKQARKPAKTDKPVDLLPTVGQKAPGFTIVDVAGRRISLKQFKGKRNVVVVFSRADW